MQQARPCTCPTSPLWLLDAKNSCWVSVKTALQHTEETPHKFALNNCNLSLYHHFDRKKTDRSHLSVGAWIWLVLSNLSLHFGTYGILIIGAQQSAGRSCCRHYNEPILMTCKPTLREFIISLAIAGSQDEEGIWYTTWIAKDILNVDRNCHDSKRVLNL